MASDMIDRKFKIGDVIKVLESPSDLNKSIGKQGVITDAPFPQNAKTGEVGEIYSVMLEQGPSRQLVYSLALLPRHMEKGDATIVDDHGKHGRLI